MAKAIEYRGQTDVELFGRTITLAVTIGTGARLEDAFDMGRFGIFQKLRDFTKVKAKEIALIYHIAAEDGPSEYSHTLEEMMCEISGNDYVDHMKNAVRIFGWIISTQADEEADDDERDETSGGTETPDPTKGQTGSNS
jgi:hypothetical protein